MSEAAELLQRAKIAIGSDALQQWQSCRLRYTVMGGGVSGHIEEWQDCRSGRYRVEHNCGLDSGAVCFDGLAVRSQDTAGFVRREGGDDARFEAMNTAYWACHALWFPERWDAKIIRLPARREDGRWYERLRVIPRGGRPCEVWFDQETLLIARLSEDTAFETRTSTLADYRLLAGVMIPHSVTITNGDARFDQQCILSAFDINPPGDATLFALRSPTALDYHWPSTTRTITLPFRLVSNLIIVEASLNGCTPLSFIVDTGACHIMTPETVRILGLEQQGRAWGFGAGAEAIDVGLTQVESLELGGIIFTQQLFRVYPFPGLP